MMYLKDTRPKPNLKPPKRRFNIGDVFFETKEKARYEVIGCYRLRDQPHEWVWLLQCGAPLRAQSEGMRAIDVYAAQTAPHVERIVVEPFRSSHEASQHFGPIPPRPGMRGDLEHVTNKNLLDTSRWRACP